MKVLGDAVLVRVVEEGEKKVGKLYVPASVSSSIGYGEVVAIGRGVISAGQIIASEIKEGDKIVYNTNMKVPMSLEGEEENLFIIKENQVLAIL